MPAARATEANILDKLIGWVAPAAALRRQRARAALSMIRGYEGAKTGRRTAGWRTTGTSANAEILPALAKLRNNSRDLVRNNSYAARAVSALVENAVSTGIVCALSEGMDAWNAWSDECDADGQHDWYGLQALMVRTVFESGECLIRLRTRRPEDGYAVPLQLQLLEPDYLDALKTGPTAAGGYIVAGVEFDIVGRRVAYWLYPQHPGEVSVIPKSLQSRRVPADQVLHLYEKQRPGQVRGVPRAAAAMLRMRDFDDYEEAELVRKGIEACFAAFVTSPEDTPLLGTESNDNANRRIETLGAGMIQYLKPGEDVSFGAPQASGGYGEYISTQLHAIAAGWGVPYELLTGDLSQVNYSSIRAGLVEFRRSISMFQWLTLVPMALRPIARAWAATAQRAGKVRRADITAEWTMPRWDWVDPLKDVLGSRQEVAGGFSAWSEQVRARGMDPAAVIQQIGKDLGSFRALGLPDELIYRILFDTEGASAALTLQESANDTKKQNRRAA